MPSKHPAQKAALNKALVQVLNLIERLRAGLAGTTDSRDEEPEYLFMSTWGTLAIRGEDTPHYRSVRDALMSLHGEAAERRLLSRRTVERLLRETLLCVLLPGRKGYNDPRPTFERRMKKELRRLRKGLSVPLRRWQFAVEVTGILPKVLPMTLGRVRFERGSKRTAESLTANVFDLRRGSTRIAPKKKIAESPHHKKTRDEVTQMFSKNAIAFAEIAALDSDAAKELGLSEVRRTIDILNFFASYFEHPVGPHRAFVAPEGRGADLCWAVYDPDTLAASWNDESSGEWDIAKLRLNSRLARRVGLERIHDLLARQMRSDLEDRIVNAVAWAGRARTTRRRQESFLLFAIALEALFTKPNARSGVTERLKLRVAHVVHRKSESRKVLANTVERLYQLRSALVHAGTSDDLSDKDVKIIDRVVELALITMLTRSPFNKMKNAAEFERWFEDRLLGA